MRDDEPLPTWKRKKKKKDYQFPLSNGNGSSRINFPGESGGELIHLAESLCCSLEIHNIVNHLYLNTK